LHEEWDGSVDAQLLTSALVPASVRDKLLELNGKFQKAPKRGKSSG